MGDDTNVGSPKSSPDSDGRSELTRSRERRLGRYLVAGLLVGAAVLITIIVASEMMRQPPTASTWGIAGFVVLAILLIIMAGAALRGLQPPPKTR